MAAGSWEFRWVERNGATYMLPTIDEAKISFKLNRPGSCELKIPLRSQAGYAIAQSTTGWGYILAYRNGTLRAVHEAASTDVGPASSEGVPSVGIAGTEAAFERLDAACIDLTQPIQFPSSAAEAGAAFQFLFALNPLFGIIPADSLGTTPVMNPSMFEQGTSVLAMLQACALRTSGFDFRFDPVLDLSGSTPMSGKFAVASILGTQRPSAAFGYGPSTRGNLESYSWKRLAGAHLANSVGVPPSGSSIENAAGVAHSADITSIGVYGPRTRYVTADFEAYALRAQLAAEHVLYRKQPRRVLEITPVMQDENGVVPEPFTDYEVGDTVPARIIDEDVTVVNGSVRVYGFEVTINKEGQEKVTIETSPETA